MACSHDGLGSLGQDQKLCQCLLSLAAAAASPLKPLLEDFVSGFVVGAVVGAGGGGGRSSGRAVLLMRRAAGAAFSFSTLALWSPAAAWPAFVALSPLARS